MNEVKLKRFLFSYTMISLVLKQLIGYNIAPNEQFHPNPLASGGFVIAEGFHPSFLLPATSTLIHLLPFSLFHPPKIMSRESTSSRRRRVLLFCL